MSQKEKFALFFGILLGDGCLHKFGNGAYAVWIDQSLKNIGFLKRLRESLRSYGSPHEYDYVDRRHKIQKRRILVYSKKLFEEFKELKEDPTTFIKELDEKEEFSYEITKQMAEMGFLGAFLPTEYGGSALDYVSYIILVEELARIDGSNAATIAAHNSLGVGPLYYYGNEEQKHKYFLT